jgi:predicted Rossmann fold nucleotide-binding protein DprA/Smf involved in DNA uptake
MPERVISGGQTGVDRAALEAALALGLACGGFCPRGRRAEDGTIPARYPLTETRSRDYRVRTRRNVLAADATLVLARGRLAGGSALTRRLALAAGKPCLVVDLAAAPAAAAVRRWLRANRVRVLNVGGPRASTHPGIHAEALAFLLHVLD